jgi:queuine tRNA-ribosyltransferase
VLATPIPRRSVNRLSGCLVQESELGVEESEDELKHSPANFSHHVSVPQTCTVLLGIMGRMTDTSLVTSFTVHHTDQRARAGRLQLPRGEVLTPAFMPVGTQATVKSLDPLDLRAVGAQIVLANTYHLMLRPGADLIERFGGVGHFMRWEGPVLTDSGGFQVFSLAANRRLSEAGVTFHSHLDGSRHVLSPERAVALQVQFGSDITMALDVCVGYGATEREQVEAMRLTHAWLPRNVQAFEELKSRTDHRGVLFGICQGGFGPGRRRESARFLADMDVAGCAIGGLSVGEPKEVMAEMLAASVDPLPTEKPRYLMGVGSPEDLWNGVAAGIDMFDCVLPTRVARRGALYTPTGRVTVTAARFREVDEPVDDTCDCYTCRTFSVAYLNHLFRAKELLGYRLASIHNLRFIQRQMEAMRESILSSTFSEARARFLAGYQTADQVVAAEQRARFRQRRESGPVSAG